MPVLECPTCHRKVAYASLDEVPERPFCSRRCRLVDLGRWLNEDYRVTEEIPDPDQLPDGEPPLPRGYDPDRG